MPLRSVLFVISGFVCLLNFATVVSGQPLPVAVPQHLDPLLRNLTIPADAPTQGMWSPPHDWPLVAIHSGVMPDGRLATFGSPIGTFDIKGLTFDLWSPKRGFTWVNGQPFAPSHRQVANPPGVDSFCAASTLLKTGELLTSGGNWTPTTSTSLLGRVSASTGPTLAHDRYYATQTGLPDGRVLITGGSTKGLWNAHDNPGSAINFISATPEVYTPGGTWTDLTGAFSKSVTGPDAFGPLDNRWWYPRQWVAPNGTVFGLSARQMWYLNPSAPGSITLVTTPFTPDAFGAVTRPNIGATSTAAMFDVGKILQLGGNGRLNAGLGVEMTSASSKRATIIDINSPGVPSLTQTSDMWNYRQWANATVLPNGRVLVTGGTQMGNDITQAALAAEIWDPAAGTWALGAAAAKARLYHSTAILLPNGTVLAAGSGGPPGSVWPANPPQFNAEVYYPPYLFQTGQGGGAALASRPRILSLSARKFNYGDTIFAEYSQGQTIAKAALIGLGSVTHGFDMGQRLYPITPVPTGTRRVALALPSVAASPSGPNVLPPGYYFLFLTNNVGVPSEGVILAIGRSDVPSANVAAPPKPRLVPVDYDGDQLSDLAFYRPSPTYGTAAHFFYKESATGTFRAIDYGNEPGTIPLAGDYDGDGRTDLAFYRPSPSNGVPAWFFHVESSTGIARAIDYGTSPTDLPLTGDYDGDGRTDLGFYRPSPSLGSAAYFFYRESATGTFRAIDYGTNPGDIPLTGDYDGDGKTDWAFYRPSPSNGVAAWFFHVESSTGIARAIDYGTNPGDIPLTGDYDGDGKTDLGFYRPSPSFGTAAYFFYKESATGTFRAIDYGTNPGDIPLTGDYDGDGRTDWGFYRPSSPGVAARFFHVESSTGIPRSTDYGSDHPADIPLGK